MCPCTECKGLVGIVINECLQHLRENGRYEEPQFDFNSKIPTIVQHV